MRNLRIVNFEENSFISQNDSLPVSAITWDSENDAVLSAFGPTPRKPVIDLQRRTRRDVSQQNGSTGSEKYVSTASWDAPCPLPDLECDRILLLHRFPDTATTCLVLAGGDLIVVRDDSQPGQEKIEIVGSVDVGISAASWSPDEELLALTTRGGSLIFMSRDLEPVTECVFTVEDLQLSKHVSVGWGKKETQFQGKRAKAMRDPTMPETVDDGKPSSTEDGKVVISWRGDGAFVAINSTISSHRRVIRVFSREGALESVSEPVDGLESALSWRPYGNLIASVKRAEAEESGTKAGVIFFERNGLKHGGFDLRLSAAELSTIQSPMSLTWNADSSVLAVQMSDRVQFWTMGNYHYYLKQEILLPDLKCIKWHPEKPLRVSIGSNSVIQNLSLAFVVDRDSTIAPFDHGAVAVIDGKRLKLTPLKTAGVPPPMAFIDIEVEENIAACAFSRTCQRIAFITDRYMHLASWEMGPALPNSPNSTLRLSPRLRTRKVKLPSNGSRRDRFTQVVVENDDTVYLLAPPTSSQNARCEKLIWVTPLSDDAEAVFEPVEIPPTTQTLVTDATQEATWVQANGSTTLIAPGHMKSQLVGDHPHSSIFKSSTESYHKVSLSVSGSLVLDQKVLTRDCTSYVLTDSHLIFTTAQNLLKFAHLTEYENIQIPGDTPEADERCRAVEKGAKLITSSPSAYAVFLQMPRGNLETVYPRVLVLNGIRKHIRNLDYRSAFLACRNHQVDLNLLFDYHPDLFFANIAKFVDQLKKPSRVDEFISKLKEEDVTQTLYKDTREPAILANETEPASTSLTNGVSDSPQPTVGKVNRICDALICVLKEKPSSYLQNVITAHVCKRPPDLVAALTHISILRQVSTDEADLAISHLCFLTDTNRLFDTALALYDLELTLLVAQNAQRDPKEYMPFLQSLQALPTLRRQFTIDNHLHNYPKALISLHGFDAHDELEAFAVKHNLYNTALKLYQHSPSHYARITRLYADYLTKTKSQHGAAASLYESLQDYATAYPLYALAHRWQESLTCASLSGLSSDKIDSLASSLATSLTEETRNYRAAAVIHAEYLNDIPNAARLLCKGSYFADALRLLSHSKHVIPQENISTIIDPALTEKFGETIELMADCKSQLAAQVPRVEDLRRKKLEDLLAFYGGDAIAGDEGTTADIPDNVSLAATDASTFGGQSLFTRYGGGSQASRFAGTIASNVSRKTSKTKRREERKRARGKKGSVYEEEYLVASVGRLIARVNSVHEEVERLVSGLVRRGLREQAGKVEEVMREIGALCEDAKSRVWPASGPDDSAGKIDEASGNIHGLGHPSGADGVFWDSQMEIDGAAGMGEPGVRKEVPEVKIWKSGVLFGTA